MATTIFLVRHGQTKSNITGYYMGRSDEDLDDTGYAQARSLSARLAPQSVTAVGTSPLRRAYSTAAAIAEPHGRRPVILDSIIEIDLGDWQGWHQDEIQQRWPELWRQSRLDPSGITFPGGESFGQVAERAVRAFKQIVSDNHQGLAIIVTHDIIIRIIVAHVLGVPNSIYRRLEINNASLTVIRVTHGDARLITLNDTSHLGYQG